MTIAALTAEQTAELKVFAWVHGRCWKRDLLQSWFADSREVNPILHGLRNTHGPSWLKRFRMEVPAAIGFVAGQVA